MPADRAGGCSDWFASGGDLIQGGVVLQAAVDGLFQV